MLGKRSSPPELPILPLRCDDSKYRKYLMSLVLNTLCMYSATENSPGRFSLSTTKVGVARTLSCRIKQTRVICMSVRLCRGASWRPSVDV